MEWQALVQDVRRGRLQVKPLDGIHPIWLAIPCCDRTYVENELLRLAPLEAGRGTDKPVSLEVLGSSLEPSYIDARPPRVKRVDQQDGLYGFVEDILPEVDDRFEEAMGQLRAGQYVVAKRALRELIAENPLHIDAYHHLGNIAANAGHLARALKYYEMGYRIGRLALPAGFQGPLPWIVLENRPFLRACHGRALALMESGRSIEAADALAELLRFNPNDNQGVRMILPNLLLQNGAWERAREVLDEIGADGTGLYTRCLIDIEAGRHRDALRWLCAAISHNPYVPGVLLDPTEPVPLQGRYVTAGGMSEAVDYVVNSGAPWRDGRGVAFLRRVLHLGPIAQRLERLLSIERELEGMPVGEERSSRVLERYALFGEDAASTIVAAWDSLP